MLAVDKKQKATALEMNDLLNKAFDASQLAGEAGVDLDRARSEAIRKGTEALNAWNQFYKFLETVVGEDTYARRSDLGRALLSDAALATAEECDGNDG